MLAFAKGRRAASRRGVRALASGARRPGGAPMPDNMKVHARFKQLVLVLSYEGTNYHGIQYAGANVPSEESDAPLAPRSRGLVRLGGGPFGAEESRRLSVPNCRHAVGVSRRPCALGRLPRSGLILSLWLSSPACDAQL